MEIRHSLDDFWEKRPTNLRQILLEVLDEHENPGLFGQKWSDWKDAGHQVLTVKMGSYDPDDKLSLAGGEDCITLRQARQILDNAFISKGESLRLDLTELASEIHGGQDCGPEKIMGPEYPARFWEEYPERIERKEQADRDLAAAGKWRLSLREVIDGLLDDRNILSLRFFQDEKSQLELFAFNLAQATGNIHKVSLTGDEQSIDVGRAVQILKRSFESNGCSLRQDLTELAREFNGGRDYGPEKIMGPKYPAKYWEKYPEKLLTKEQALEETETTHDFDKYAQSVRGFLHDSRAWSGLSPKSQYTSDKNGGWKKTDDNAHGGLDVGWAFAAARNLSNDKLRAYFESVVSKDPGGAFSAEIKSNWYRLCDEEVRRLDDKGLIWPGKMAKQTATQSQSKGLSR